MPLWVAVCGLATLVANFLLAWLIASSLIIAAGLIGARLVRSRGSAVQSAIYRTTLVLAVLTPLLTWAIGTIGVSFNLVSLPVLPAAARFEVYSLPAATTHRAPAAVTAVERGSFAPATPGEQANSSANRWEFEVTPDLRSLVSPTPSVEPETEAAMTPRAMPSAVPAVEVPRVTPRVPEIVTAWRLKPLAATAAVAICLAWFLVSSILLARLAVQFRHVRWLSKRAVPTSDDEQQHCQQLARRLQVAAPRLLRTPFISSPCLTGVVSPVILLPDEFPASQVTLALVHELAHLARRDCLWNLIRHLATSLMWWQPLVWRLSQRIEAAAEEVCDDYAVEFGADRASYAELLLSLAEGSLLPAPYAAVPLVTFRSAMSQRVRRILDRTRRLTLSINPAALLAIIVIGSATALATGLAVTGGEVISSPPVDETVAKANAPEPPESRATVPAESDKKKLPYLYRGEVRGPDNQPIGGAKIFLVYWSQLLEPGTNYLPIGTTSAEGKFECEFDPAQQSREGDEGFVGQLVAQAPGFGIALGSGLDFEVTGRALASLPKFRQAKILERQAKQKQTTLKLVADDNPIQGQVLSSEGKPVAGARVRLKGILSGKGESLDAWEETAKLPVVDYYLLRQQTENGLNGPQLPSIVPDVVTDAAGHFEMRGIGRERVAEFFVSGPGIETVEVNARTRTGDKVVVPAQRGTSSKDIEDVTYWPSQVTWVVGPSRPVRGRVVDADTGAPLAGVMVRAGQQGTFFRMGQPHIAAMTDRDGKYSLEGLPPGSADIYAFPPRGTRYLPSGAKAAISLEKPSEDRDFRLKQGVLVQGYARDRRTGEPVSGRVQYAAFENNPNLKSFPGFARSGHGPEERADRNGHFEIAVLPGAGLLSFSPDDHTRYRRAQGVESIMQTAAGAAPADPMRMPFSTVPMQVFASNEHTLQPIDLAVDTPAKEIEFKLNSGVDVPGKIVDSTGEPVADGLLGGDVQVGIWYEYPGAWREQRSSGEFRVEGYYPDAPRDLFFFEPQRNLAGHYRLQGDPPAEIKLQLQPAGAAQGRLVDAQGLPIAEVRIYGDGIPSLSSASNKLVSTTDADGRFHVRGLIPGRKYTVLADGYRVNGSVVKDLTIAAGEAKELGEVRLGPAPDEQAEASPAEAKPASLATPAASSARMVIKGRVVGPDQQPLSTATVGVYLWKRNATSKRNAPLKARTNAEGNFLIEFSRTELTDEQESSDWREFSTLIATAPGFGAAWVNGAEPGRTQEPVIQLVPVEPIEGRIIDLEGQPVAGADVRLDRVSANASGDLTPWLNRLRDGIPWDYSRSDDGSGMPTRQMPASDALADESTKTDPDGRFRLNGVGRDRLATLHVSGKGIVFSELRVVTLPIQAFTCQAGNSGFWRTATIFGSRFEYAAEPSQPIEGVVRDSKSGVPIPGVSIVSNKLANENVSGHHQLKTISDADGRYRLDGMPKGEGNQLLAMPPDEQPYLMLEVDVPTGPGFEVVKCDLELHRGVFITGRVSEKGTGDPIRGRIFYLPWPDNPYAVGLPEFNSNRFFGPQDRYQAGADGRYRIVGLPGRGLIEISCGSERPYPTGQGRREILDLPKKSEFEKSSQIFAPSEGFPTAIQEVNIAEDASEANADLELSTGEQVTLNVLDPQRQPIDGVTVMGHWPKPQYKREVLGPSIEILALKPDEKRLVFLHHESRNLGRAVYVTARSDNQPQTVVLEPCSKLIGRILDKDGRPVRQATLQVFPSNESDFSLRLPTGHTDDDGQIVGVTLFTGCSYHVMCQSAQARFNNLAQYLTVRPGEIIDLGEFDVTARLPKPTRRPAEKNPAMNKPVAAQADGAAPAAVQSPQMKSKTTGNGFALAGNSGVGAKQIEATATFVPDSAAPSPKQRPEPEGEVIKVRGRVVDPEGTPMPNADVLAVRTNWRNWDKRPPIAQTRSDQLGDFEIEYRKSQIQDPAVPQRWRQPAIVAVAAGFGPAWIKYDQIAPGTTATLKLVRDEPIEGRIVDLEGHPVAGVTVEVQQIRANGKEDLSQWLDMLKGIDPGTKMTGFAMPLSAQKKKMSDEEMESPVPNRTLPTDDGLLSIKAQTDANGRFRLTGVGRERVASLRLLGGGVAVAQLNAVTRKMDPIVLPQGGHLPNLSTYFGNQVQFAAEPSQVIEGVVRDAQSGAPIPNARIVSNKLAGSDVMGMHIVDTHCDAEGRYRLEGMPKGKGNEIVVLPGPDQPYFARILEVSSTDDLRPVKFDPQLHRGVWISGRVTEKESKNPVNAQMFYLPWPNNPSIRGLSEFNDSAALLAILQPAPHTDSDGAYRLLGMPGRGLIEVNPGFNHPYPQGQGIAEIDDLPSENELRRVGALYAPTKDWPAAVKEVLVDQPTELTNVDVTLDAGNSLLVQFVDPQGKPIDGLTVRGLWPPAQYREVNDAGSTVEVLALWPDEQRLILVHHDERKLAKAASVCFNKDHPGPKTIQLEPYATVSGRILDGEGKPITGAQIQFNTTGQPLGGPQLYWESTDAEGRFKNTAVIPGCKYKVVCQSPQLRFATVVKELSVTAGESIELGDIDIDAKKK